MITVKVKKSEEGMPVRATKWCRICGRKHNHKEACGLEVVNRTVTSGREVTRLALPIKES